MLRSLAITLSLALPISLGGCTGSENLSSKGQLIECQVAADGTTSNCQAVDQPSGNAGTCVDRDEDGDGDDHDADEADDDTSAAVGDDEDGDGTPDSEDSDDDDDGIDDADDCDELPGGDSDDGV